MKINKLSTNRWILFSALGYLITLIPLIILLYRRIEGVNSISIITYMFFISIFWCSILIVSIRRKLVLFSTEICKTLDNMMNGDIKPPVIDEEEYIYNKISFRISRLYEIMQKTRNSVSKEKLELQELISDISHQVKTPISNIKMINTTLMGEGIPKEKRQKFMRDMDGELDKLDFLIDSMIKTSRLETGIITLEKKNQSIYDTLAMALGGILFSAEKKNINVSVNCPEELKIPHDRKWTAEALFNILDNAVKYSPNNSEIIVTVESWEMYLKIDIMDTGKGISESKQAEIFKRFYREEESRDIDGVGIGLYLARQIITRQGGYIKVSSELEKGSVFSVFLPNISV